MPITSISSREFNQFHGRAKRAAHTGPVFITERGEPSYVLLTYDEFKNITQPELSLADILACPEAADIEIVFPKINLQTHPVVFDECIESIPM